MKFVLKPEVIFEVGAGTQLKAGKYRTIGEQPYYVFEPNPYTFKLLKEEADKLNDPNIHLFNAAISDKEEMVLLNVMGDNSFIEGVNSPVLQNNTDITNIEKLMVPALPISKFDPGNVDLLLIDTEGNEYKVLKTLISQPPIIQIEMHDKKDDKKYYINPETDNIKEWMKNHDYVLVEETESDCLYAKTYLLPLIQGRHKMYLSN